MVIKLTINNDKKSSDLKNSIISPKSDSLFFKKHADIIKLYIDTKLDNMFRNGKKIALIRDIDAIPVTAMFLFYTYGDEMMNAKFPGKTINYFFLLNI